MRHPCYSSAENLMGYYIFLSELPSERLTCVDELRVMKNNQAKQMSIGSKQWSEKRK